MTTPREKLTGPTHNNFLPRKAFLKKVRRNFFLGIIAILLALGVGMAGYQHYERMSWVDAYVNAAMILSGMGPVTELKTLEGKLFAGTYALFSGIFFLVIMALIFAPVIHRLFHTFHIEEKKKDF